MLRCRTTTFVMKADLMKLIFYSNFCISLSVPTCFVALSSLSFVLFLTSRTLDLLYCYFFRVYLESGLVKDLAICFVLNSYLHEYLLLLLLPLDKALSLDVAPLFAPQTSQRLPLSLTFQ